ncbi:MAG: BTAD domain-containing putative transcriptional regulator [Ktedonobacteraceae bacterium]
MRHALWQLQSAFGSQTEPTNDRVLLVEPEWVQLNLEANFWLDVVIFKKAFDLVQKVPGHELDAQRVQVLQDAVQLYEGPLLEGWYQDWCLLERVRLQNMYLAMLDKLMSYCEALHDYETSLLYGMRIMCYDRARERTHRRLMRLYYRLGDRAEALRQYERCAGALEEELGVRPSKSTVALYKQIQADQLNEPEFMPVPKETNTAFEVSTTPLIDILSHLRYLEGSLADLQNQIQQSIQKVELVLSNSR